MIHLVLISLAVIALVCVVFEEQTGVAKSKVTLICGCFSWVILFVTAGPENSLLIASQFTDNVAEIANLWLFLIAAMTFVAYLNKKGLIEYLIRFALPGHISERSLMFLTGLFGFAFSSLADNITATLVSCTLVLSLGLSQAKTLRFAVMVVFAVNSGGVALITGDVTTLMIFLAGKVSILQLLLLSLPGFLAVMLLAALLSIGLGGQVTLERRSPRVSNSDTPPSLPTISSIANKNGGDRRDNQVNRVDLVIAGLFFLTIVLTMFANITFGIPPVLSFLTGLSIMFLVATFFKADIDEDPIMEYIRLVEFETLFFFLGVLMIVGTLQEIGTLSKIADLYTNFSPLLGNYVVGLFSALIDNVPLTAALIKAGPEMADHEWLSLTYAVGVGGSLLIIGSAAGIVAMSKIPGLTVATYARYSPLLLLAYSAGYLGAAFLTRLMNAI